MGLIKRDTRSLDYIGHMMFDSCGAIGVPADNAMSLLLGNIWVFYKIMGYIQGFI